MSSRWSKNSNSSSAIDTAENKDNLFKIGHIVRNVFFAQVPDVIIPVLDADHKARSFNLKHQLPPSAPRSLPAVCLPAFLPVPSVPGKPY